MISSISMQRGWIWSVALLACAGTIHAEDLRDWYCPYTTDGACAPKRQTYGYFAPKWRRWPGVTSADYESKRPPQEPTPPPADTEGPGLPPSELLLPPTDFRRDEAPAPPEGAGQPQPLTPDSEPTPDILSPPGEDIMDELLPGVEPPSQPAAKPSAPRRSAPADDGSIPFPEAQQPSDRAPAPRQPVPAEPAPKRTAPANPEGESDPFKDDPFFNDAAPAPSESRQPQRLDRQLEFPSQSIPATHEAPARLPAAGLNRIPRSRLTQDPGSAESLQPVTRRDLSRATLRANPLRAGTPPAALDAPQVMPAAAWQAEADQTIPASLHDNILR